MHDDQFLADRIEEHRIRLRSVAARTKYGRSWRSFSITARGLIDCVRRGT